MPNPGLTSIIIPSHNEGLNLKRTVDSIFENTNQNPIEIMIVDDASNYDDSAFLNNKPYKLDSRLLNIRLEESVGCVRARQQGVLLSNGDNLLFMDAHLALTPDWLNVLLHTLECWGPNLLITPDITILDDQNWLPNVSSGMVMSIDEKFNLTWVEAPYPSNIVPVVGGGCVLTSRNFFYSIGGFDLGIQRWGPEFIDLSLKAYAAGGMCIYEPAVLVGHLFRNAHPYEMRYKHVNYNKLRLAYIHFEDELFHQLVSNIQDEPEFSEGYELFQKYFWEIEKLRLKQKESNLRPPDWYRRMFLINNAKGIGKTLQSMDEDSLRIGGKTNDGLTCLQCGKQNSSHAKFCSFCGTKLGNKLQPKVGLCRQCGTYLLLQSKYCNQCGAKIG
jgi:glycosyltransferase involved in cell wall biosynthesis